MHQLTRPARPPFGPFFLLLLTLLAAASFAQAQQPESRVTETVSIWTTIARQTLHACVLNCLVPGIGSGDENMGRAMECADPAVNHCYCATAAAQASAAVAFIPSCAARSCARGDAGHDASVMLDVYAAYCRANGFDAGAGWVLATATAAPTQTGSDAMTPRTTTTIPTGPNGSPISTAGPPADDSGTDSSNDSSTAPPTSNQTVLAVGLGVGLGVGIPLVLVLGAIAVLLLRRQRREEVSRAAPPSMQDAAAKPAGMGGGTVSLAQGEPELDGRPVPVPAAQAPQPQQQGFSVVGPDRDSTPVQPLHGDQVQVGSVLPQQYEMSGEGVRAELLDRNYSTPPPRY